MVNPEQTNYFILGKIIIITSLDYFLGMNLQFNLQIVEFRAFLGHPYIFTLFLGRPYSLTLFLGRSYSLTLFLGRPYSLTLFLGRPYSLTLF